MNNDTVAGKFDQISGKIKETVGEAIGNENLANRGAAEQVKGAGKETWGNVKDTANDASSSSTSLHNDTRTTGHEVRHDVTSGAQNVKNSISDKLDDLKR